MTDLENILPLWHELEASGADYVLATIVAVEGSSYRKPGARMLLAQDGRRAGTVSGGCLEAEVARRAWWLTVERTVVERYSTVDDDGDLPFGSGCGGVVFILLERRTTAASLIAALEAAFAARTSLAIAAILEGPRMGRRAYAGLPEGPWNASGTKDELSDLAALEDLAKLSLIRCKSLERIITVDGVPTRAWVDYRAARPGLWIFGAGDDAKPLVNLARELGWFVGVADGRSNLATRERFPRADAISVLPIKSLPDEAERHLALRTSDAVVIMTHSYEQDARILGSVLRGASESIPTYIGVLGPQRRTRELLAEVERLLDLPADSDRVDHWLEMAQLHTPMGLDVGAETPATIALSILAEIQQTLNAATALPLRQVRATRIAAAQY
jgi:xanthine/CO dehydrogenase XdhC/CoxF family maturation factor